MRDFSKKIDENSKDTLDMYKTVSNTKIENSYYVKEKIESRYIDAWNLVGSSLKTILNDMTYYTFEYEELFQGADGVSNEMMELKKFKEKFSQIGNYFYQN